MSERRRFRSETSIGRCGSKGTTNSYDPQIGAAAAANSDISARAAQFGEDFQTQNVAPLLHQMAAASAQTQVEQQQLFGLNIAQTEQSQARYQQQGIPAEDKYYDMVAHYSAPEEQEREAQGALGDMRTAESGQRATLMRQQAAMGINPASPAALALGQQTSTVDAAAEAAAMNRARNTARTMGMQLTSDAANFGRGGQSGILQFGSAASGNANSGSATAQGALGAASNASGTQLAGYRTAQAGYGANLSAYTSLGTADMQAQAAADSALGQGIGSAFGAAATYFSDRRLKKNIKLLARKTSGVGIYSFEYKWSPKKHVGYMADEVIKMFPAAVIQHVLGYMMVDYGMVG